MSTLELLPTAPVHDIWARREILASFVGKTGVPPGVFQATRHVKNAKRLLAANLTLVGQENGTKIGKGTRSPTYARRGIHITQPSSHGHMAVRKCLEDQCAAFLCRLPAGSRIPLPNTSGRLPGCLELGVMGGGAGGGLAGGLTLLARRRQLQPQIAPQILVKEKVYVEKFLAANVETEFHIYSGLPHAFEGLASGHSVAREMKEKRI